MPLRAVPSQNFIQKTLNAQLLTGVTASATLNNTTAIQNLPGVFIVDRVDSNGTETPSQRETVGYTAVSGSTLTGLSRGLAGSTDQDHAVGAIVEFVADVVWAQSVYDALSQVITPSTGTLDISKVASASGGTLTSTTLNFGSGATGSMYFEQSGKVGRLEIGATHSFLVATATQPRWYAPSGASGSVLTSTGTGLPVYAPTSGTGGLNAIFNIPGGLASLSGTYPGIGGAIPVSTSFTLSFMHGYLGQASSNASVSVLLLNKNSQIGMITFPAGATYASSASISTAALVSGDVLTIGVNSYASLAQDLSLAVRAI